MQLNTDLRTQYSECEANRFDFEPKPDQLLCAMEALGTNKIGRGEQVNRRAIVGTPES